MVSAFGILPVLEAYQEERVAIAYEQLIQPDALATDSAVAMEIGFDTDAWRYLCQHPTKALRRCLDTEADAPAEDVLQRNRILAAALFAEVYHETLDTNQPLEKSIRESDSDLLQELGAP